MAVKDGLPATDFSRQNREWVRNVAEGESVPDGLPATDFSRMNREWVKAVAAGGGGGGGITVEPLTVTENDTYTAPEGKAYSPVTVNVSGGGGGDFTTAAVTVVNNQTTVPITIWVPVVLEDPEDSLSVANNQIYVEAGQSQTFDVILYKNLAWGTLLYTDKSVTVTGDVFYDNDGLFEISGNGTITIADE